MTNAATGERWQTITGGRGRYRSSTSPSAAHTRSKRAPSASRRPPRRGITLSLGERHRVDLVLAPAVTQLAEVTVTAEADPATEPGRTGPAQSIAGAMISNFPLPRRDFSRLVLLSPQAVLTRDGGITIAGQSDRLNGIPDRRHQRVGPGRHSGLSGFGTPGAASGVRTLSVEAVRELQILVAPFDVRYGNFAGGLVNAVTRSGSNRWEGSVTGLCPGRVPDGTGLGGQAGRGLLDQRADGDPGRADRPRPRRVLSRRRPAAIRRPARPSRSAPTPPEASTRSHSASAAADAVRFQDILRDTYHVDPGSIEQIAPRNPAGNVLAKISLWPALNQRIELSHNYARGTPQCRREFGRRWLPLVIPGTSARPSTVNASRLAWTMSGTGGALQRAHRRAAQRTGKLSSCRRIPGADRVGGRDGSRSAPGRRNVCSQRFANQTIWELTDNASWSMGAHHLTLGTHDELIHLERVRRVRGSRPGGGSSTDLDSLEQGSPSEYVRDFAGPSTAGKSVDDFEVHQIGLYLQDQWAPAYPGSRCTGGLRFDVPYLPTTPGQNPALHRTPGHQYGASHPAATSSGHPGSVSTMTSGRGGRLRARRRGLFSGRPIYLYFSNIFETNGVNLFHMTAARTRDVPRIHDRPGAAADQLPLERRPWWLRGQLLQSVVPIPRGICASRWEPTSRCPEASSGRWTCCTSAALDQLDITDVNLLPPTTTSPRGRTAGCCTARSTRRRRATPNRRDPASGPWPKCGTRAATAPSAGRCSCRSGSGAARR